MKIFTIKNLIRLVIILAVVAAGFVIYTNRGQGPAQVVTSSPTPSVSPTPTAENSLDEFAKCLTEKGVKFYGAYWCGHCANQKQMFGDSMKFVNYIECEKKPGSSRGDIVDACKEAKIEAYPTWDFSGDKRELGEMPLESLGELSGCPLK